MIINELLDNPNNSYGSGNLTHRIVDGQAAQLVFAILAPLLLLMALAFAWGFVKKAY